MAQYVKLILVITNVSQDYIVTEQRYARHFPVPASFYYNIFVIVMVITAVTATNNDTYFSATFKFGYAAECFKLCACTTSKLADKPTEFPKMITSATSKLSQCCYLFT